MLQLEISSDFQDNDFHGLAEAQALRSSCFSLLNKSEILVI